MYTQFEQFVKIYKTLCVNIYGSFDVDERGTVKTRLGKKNKVIR